MTIVNVKEKITIPADMVEHLSGLSVEDQLQYFSLEFCQATTFSITCRKIENPEKYSGKHVCIDKYPILVQDGIIVGVDIGEELYCFEHPCSKIRSYNGHRTSTDYWYYDEDHEWYVFRYIGKAE